MCIDKPSVREPLSLAAFLMGWFIGMLFGREKHSVISDQSRSMAPPQNLTITPDSFGATAFYYMRHEVNMKPSAVGDSESHIRCDTVRFCEQIKEDSIMSQAQRLCSSYCFNNTAELKQSMSAHWKLSIFNQYWIRAVCPPQKINVPCTASVSLSFHNKDRCWELHINKNNQQIE